MSVDVGLIGNSRDEHRTCEVCGGPITGWHRDIVDDTDVLRDHWQVMIPGQAYNEPCNCPIPGTAARPRRHEPVAGVDFSDLRQTLDRTPSGEHTSADTDDVVARIDSAVEDWETLDGARWSPDGSHEHDPEPWTRRDMGVQQGQADWGCDDVAEQMENPDAYPTVRLRPGSLACFPWASYRYQDGGPVASPWAENRDPDLAERLARAVSAIDRWRRRIGR